MFCAYTRPRYQVSVYRTIGPLVILVLDKYRKFIHWVSSHFSWEVVYENPNLKDPSFQLEK